VADAFLQAGYAAEHIDGETPAIERRAILERFRTGETAILTNCGIVSEGLDVPGIEAVQCLRPTRSLVLYLQMLGRGLRPSAGKNCLIILDHTENWIYHGLPDEEHEWSLDPVSLRNAERAVECPDCQHCFKPQPHEQKSREATCPNCGAIIELDEPGEGEAVERVIQHDDAAALEEIDLETNPTIMAFLQNLKQMQEQHGYKIAWVYHQLVKQYPNVGLEDLRECAKILGYKPGWAWYRWQELQQQQAA
jgi:superfamily II DNA or RNA helicase